MDRALDNIASNQMALVRHVYLCMCIALAITGVTSYVVSTNSYITHLILDSKFGIWILFGIQFVLVIYLSARIMKMTLQTASIVFILYSFISGVTFSFIFLLFSTGTIASCFFITAGTFLAMSLYGFLTKRDLSSWGNILFMALIGIIIASLVNFFMHSRTLYWIISYVGVLVFAGLTAYDSQKIKSLIGQENNEVNQKAAIIGALMLYLDFINMFLFFLQIFGGRRG